MTYMSGGQTPRRDSDKQLKLRMNIAQGTTCPYHMPYVVAYVVAVVEVSSRTFQGSVGADSRRNNSKNVHAAIEDQAPGRSGRPDARPR